MSTPQVPADPYAGAPGEEPRDADGRAARAEQPASAWSRLRAALAPKINRAQLLGALLCGILGFSLVVQVADRNEANLDALRDEELVRLLDDLTAQSDRLTAQEAKLTASKERLENEGEAAEAAQKQAQSRLDTLSILSGVVPAAGPGVEVTITDPKASVTSVIIVGAIQELRDAGAEVISVGEARVVASTSVVSADGALEVDGVRLDNPYVIKAIGEPDTLSTALRIRGGVQSTVQGRDGAGISIKTVDRVVVSAVVEPPAS